VLRKSLILLAAAFALALCPAPASAQNALVNGIDANFPPFAFVGPDGKAAGFDIEALDWIAAKAGFTVEHRPMEWDSIVQSLKDKKIDIIASGLSVTPARAEQIAFTEPYWTINQVILVRNDSPITDAEEALKGGHSIGVQRGTSDAAAMEATNGNDGRNYTLSQYDSYELAVADVINGRIEAAVMNDAPAAKAASEQDVKIIGEAGVDKEEFAYGVNKENPELLAQLNEGLAALKRDPFFQALKDKYRPGEVH
jgi:polar amino acid transport system substrate-binding protein